MRRIALLPLSATNTLPSLSTATAAGWLKRATSGGPSSKPAMPFLRLSYFVMAFSTASFCAFASTAFAAYARLAAITPSAAARSSASTAASAAAPASVAVRPCASEWSFAYAQATVPGLCGPLSMGSGGCGSCAPAPSPQQRTRQWLKSVVVCRVQSPPLIMTHVCVVVGSLNP